MAQELNMDFLKVIFFLGYIAFVIGCHSTVYEKGCCTSTTINNYCKSDAGGSELKSKLQDKNTKKENKPYEVNRWGQIIIPPPTPRSKRECDCTVDFMDCLERYNDYAMENGFDLVIVDEADDTFAYRKKRQADESGERSTTPTFTVTAPAETLTTKISPSSTVSTYSQHNRFIIPASSITNTGTITIKPKPSSSTIPPPASRNPTIPPNSLRNKFTIPTELKYIYDSNKTLDMSRTIVEFLAADGARLVKLETSIGNYDSLDQFLTTLKSSASPDIINALQLFTVENADVEFLKQLVDSFVVSRPELVLDKVFSNPASVKDYCMNHIELLQNFFREFSEDDFRNTLWSKKIDPNTLSHLIKTILEQHPGYIATALMRNDVTDIVAELKRRSSLKLVRDKFN